MVKLPRNVSPAAAARRSLLFDICLGILVGIGAVIVAAGIGVVGFFALLVALALLLWYLAEVGLRWTRRRRKAVTPLSEPRRAGSRSSRERR